MFNLGSTLSDTRTSTDSVDATVDSSYGRLIADDVFTYHGGFLVSLLFKDTTWCPCGCTVSTTTRYVLMDVDSYLGVRSIVDHTSTVTTVVMEHSSLNLLARWIFTSPTLNHKKPRSRSNYNFMKVGAPDLYLEELNELDVPNDDDTPRVISITDDTIDNDTTDTDTTDTDPNTGTDTDPDRDRASALQDLDTRTLFQEFAPRRINIDPSELI
jgi:hypothetical protein